MTYRAPAVQLDLDLGPAPDPVNFEVVHGDLYDRRTGKRLRHGYCMLFYQILDGHQLRATLRFLETDPQGKHFVCVTDTDGYLCLACVRDNLRGLIRALREPWRMSFRVIAVEPRYNDRMRCDICDIDIPKVEDQS
jgi:hypothetical protein